MTTPISQPAREAAEKIYTTITLKERAEQIIQSAITSALAEQSERIDWLEQQREVECQQKQFALNESEACLKETEAIHKRLSEQSRELAQKDEEIEKGRQWNALLELELANLRSIKPVCYVCEQLMEQRGEDATDFICVNCDRAYRESQKMLCETIRQRESLVERMLEIDEIRRRDGVTYWTGNGEPI